MLCFYNFYFFDPTDIVPIFWENEGTKLGCDPPKVKSARERGKELEVYGLLVYVAYACETEVASCLAALSQQARYI